MLYVEQYTVDRRQQQSNDEYLLQQDADDRTVLELHSGFLSWLQSLIKDSHGSRR